MDNLKLNCICAFCNTETDSEAISFLQTFNQQFISNPLFQINYNYTNDLRNNCENSLPDNWSICGNCLPQVQLLLGSKQKVDKVDSEVRYLQKRILTEMKKLLEEMDQMCGEMVMIEGILRSNPGIPATTTGGGRPVKKKRGRPPTSKLNDGDHKMDQFRQNVFNVLRDLQVFRLETSNRLLLKSPPSKTPPGVPSPVSPKPVKLLPVPKLKVELENEDTMEIMDMDTEENFISPPTSPPSNDIEEDDDSSGQQWKRKRKSVSLRKPADYNEDLDLTSSSNEEDPEDDDDFEFDPNKPRVSAKLKKKISTYSPFRQSLISRIRAHSTISTSPHLPSSESDPRRPFFIKYDSPKDQFSIKDIPFHCLDFQKSLHCSQCDYTINHAKCLPKKGATPRERHIEDFIFDHILSKHLHTYNCKLCGKGYQSGRKFNLHLRSHQLEFTCDICQRPLASGMGLKTHKWTHLNEDEKKDPRYQSWMPFQVKYKELVNIPKFQCETCGKAFKRSNLLKDHEATHLDKEEREKEKVICADCGVQVFLNSLKAHQRKWCEKVRGPPKGVDCKVCGENFRTLKVLDEHLRERHPEEKIWECEVCGMRFKSKPRLRIHRARHWGEKRFLCERCGRGFKDKKNCKRHEGTCKEGK